MHVKYEMFIYYCSNVIEKVKVYNGQADKTSILKVLLWKLLKQYKSPTGPNKFPWDTTPTKADQRGQKWN